MSRAKLTGTQAITITALALPEFLLDALVFSILWGWFVVPLGVRPVGKALALGLMLTVRFITMKRDSTPGKTFDELLSDVGAHYGTIGFLFVAGWIVHLLAS